MTANPNQQIKAPRTRLGQGRSGTVYKIETADGTFATKVFHGDTLSNLLHYLFYGAPNPYIWNEDAIRCAYERRKLLSILVPFWTNGRCSVANSVDTHWNREARGWELITEYVDGRAVLLTHPLRPENDELDLLRCQVAEPLIQELQMSGFDGIVWQAGLGNPV
ncbi:MAG: hypothetical protein ACK4UN_11845, partial [Limisphaerales bacterium]